MINYMYVQYTVTVRLLGVVIRSQFEIKSKILKMLSWYPYIWSHISQNVKYTAK